MSTAAHELHRSLTKPVLMQMAGAAFCALVSFALTLWLARVLGTARFGEYIACLNLAAVALIFQEGGWPAWLYRARAQNSVSLPATQTAWAWGHMLWTTLLFMALARLLPAHAASWAALLCMGAVAVMNGVSSLMRGAGLFAQEALWQSAGRLVSAIAVVWVAYSAEPPDLAVIFLAWAAGLAVVLAWGAKAWLNWPRWPGAEGWQPMRRRYEQLWPFVLMAASGAWLVKGDMVLLQWQAVTPEQASHYAACTRLTEAGLLVFAPFANVLFRHFNQLQTMQPSAMTHWGLRSASLALVVGAIGWGLTGWLGDALMAGLFGDSFAPAGSLLPWVMAMWPLAMVNTVLALWLTARGQERDVSLIMLLAAVSLTVCLPWWLHVWGLPGAALAVVLAQALQLAGSAWRLSRRA